MARDSLDFDEIYSNFQPKIQRYLARLVNSYEAEDLTQEVFLKVEKALDEFQGQAKLSTWIYKIATNAALDRLRSPSYKSIHNSIDEHELEVEDVTSCTTEKSLSTEQKVIQGEMNDCIREFIEKLPEDYSAVMILSELEGLKNQEIADVLGVSLDIVKIRLYRARKKLKKELEKGCSFYHNERNQLSCDRKTCD